MCGKCNCNKGTALYEIGVVSALAIPSDIFVKIIPNSLFINVYQAYRIIIIERGLRQYMYIHKIMR